MKTLDEAGQLMQKAAAASFGNYKDRAKEIIPALLRHINDTGDPRLERISGTNDVKLAVVFMLGQFGTNAQQALPAVSKLLIDSDESVRQMATNTVSLIQGWQDEEEP